MTFPVSNSEDTSVFRAPFGGLMIGVASRALSSRPRIVTTLLSGVFSLATLVYLNVQDIFNQRRNLRTNPLENFRKPIIVEAEKVVLAKESLIEEDVIAENPPRQIRPRTWDTRRKQLLEATEQRKI